MSIPRDKLVSIVLPTYNGARFIKDSIQSCLQQTYHNIELIVIDDGSTDDSHVIIKNFKDSRLKYFRNEKNKGLPRSLNIGFDYSEGAFLTWTSDDNLYKNNSIQEMASILNSGHDFIYCDYYNFQNNNLDIVELVKLPGVPILKEGNCIGCCFMYRRKVFEKIGYYDTDFKLAEDFDYWIRVSKRFNLYHHSVPLYYYRRHKESLYSKKFYEVKMSDFLARYKNKLISLDECFDLIIDLGHKKIFESKRSDVFMSWLIIFVKVIRKLVLIDLLKLMMKAQNKQKVLLIFKKFEDEKISFLHLKKRLNLFIKNI